MPRTPHIPWRADTTQSRDCELPRRCPRCLPSRLPRHCPRSLPSRLSRRCLRWPRTRLPRYCLQSRPSPRLRRCPCWRSSPQLSRCQGQPLSPTELPQTHPPSHVMISACFGGCPPRTRSQTLALCCSGLGLLLRRDHEHRIAFGDVGEVAKARMRLNSEVVAGDVGRRPGKSPMARSRG